MIHRSSTKHLRFTASPSIRASQDDQAHKHNSPSKSDVEPRAVGTGTSQCSTYELKHGGNGAIGTDEYDHERHIGATQDASGGANEPNKVKEEILLLELP